MCSNRLKLNGEKTHIMLLSTDRAWRSKLTADSLVLTTENNISIRTSNCENLLGGVIAQNLKWAQHILLHKKSLVKQLGFRLAALKKICQFANFQERKMIANGLFMSKLLYLIPLWGGCEEYLIRALQVTQNKAARFVAKRGPFKSTKVLLKECGWLSVSQLEFYHSVILLFKAKRSQNPAYIFDMTVNAENVRYGARSSQVGKLRVVGRKLPQCSLNENSFRWRSTRYWNKLPLELRKMDNLVKFKKSLKTWVQKNIKIT